MRVRKHEQPELSLEDHARWWKDAGGWQLRQILYWQWDPIGVNDAFPYAYDEYNGYAGSVMARLKAGADADVIEELLHGFERDDMGLGPTEPADRMRKAVAVRIAAWYPASIAWWKDRG